jgi:hypothetical protein
MRFGDGDRTDAMSRGRVGSILGSRVVADHLEFEQLFEFVFAAVVTT